MVEGKDLARREACGFGPGGTSPLPPLAQLAIVVHTEVVAIAERLGLTPMQGRMLGLLARGPLRMNELAQRLGVEKAAATGLVDRAEARGLVAREAIPGDRRSIHVAVTDAGTSACSEFYERLHLALDAMIATLPEADRDTFTSWTQAVVGAWMRSAVPA
ncbi:MarR family winged helix-turn-helix transcriptional regulator [Georgenia ruanii]|uniref:MarR family transcriptional regulator n=1 Tax=Georgenia ruanii TaxID=348442 RepID=A0A7J9V1G4_9MICO|nr:MarR family transcriptional regulator [Georgenia ruanii]MPV90522.1 MarR family transcriptional regulator [Georgenia ruanii]